ncbi:MAG: Ankyrin repeat domain-containing protein 13B [Marteilia pararefringens]
MTDSPRKVPAEYDAPPRATKTTKANDKQQQLFRAAYDADSDRFLHLWHNEFGDKERELLLSSAIRDCRGRSLLALCVFAQNLRLATFLVEQGADLGARVMAQSKCSPLDEAVLLRDLDMVQLIVSNGRDRTQNESSEDFKVLLEQLKRLPDIYLEFVFNVSVTNFLFFLNPLMPNDRYRVFKKGKQIRFDFTLAGFSIGWIHKDQTIIVKDCTCCEKPSVLLTHILHPEKIYSQQCMSKYNNKGQKGPLGSKPEKKSSPVATKQKKSSSSEPIATNSQRNLSDSKSIQLPNKDNAEKIRKLFAEDPDDNEEVINKYFDKMVIESIVNGPIIHFSHHPEKIRFVPIEMNFFENAWEKTKSFFKSNSKGKSQPGRIMDYEVEGMLSITTTNDRENLPLVRQFLLPVLDAFKKKNVIVDRLREFLTSDNLPGLPVKISLAYKLFYCTFEFKNLFNEQCTQPGVKYNSMGHCEISDELFTVPTGYKKVKYEELMSHLKFDYGSMFAQVSEHI